MSQTMIAANQSRFAFKSAGLAADAVQVSEFMGVEEVSHTFRFVVQLASTDGELDLDAVVGQPATLALMRQDGEASPIHAIVSDFQQKAFTTGNYYYEATLVPRLWLLSLNHQCRVFQNLKVDEIVTEVLKQAGFSARDFRFVLRTKLPTREYCVQYRETDLAFIQRLLEHEGIYYFFEHPSSGGEVVVFTDDRAQSPDIDGSRAIEYHPGAGLGTTDEVDYVREFGAQRQLVSGKVILKDYNYRTPETHLLASANLGHPQPGVYYDYGAHFKNATDGERLAQVRTQEFDARRKLFHGETNAPALRVGHIFALTKHFRGDFNADYLLTRVEHQGSQGRAFGIGLDAQTRPVYQSRFTAILATTQLRPARETPIPRLSGIITARLETGGGDYAYIDDQGRYRVKLPFDLSDNSNGTASRAIRMAQPYSGPNYGMHFPNRADTEMVLACVDGDVDRPMGLSTVPNPSNASPSVAGNKAQCVIRSAGQNELTLDDSIGSENILLHGTKDWTVSINNDKNATIGNNHSSTIGKNETHHIGVDQAITIGSNQTMAVGANRDKRVAANETETIGANKTIAVGGNHNEMIAANMTKTVGGAGAETIGLAKALSIGAGYAVQVGAIMNESIGGAKMEEIGAAKMVNIGGLSSENVGISKTVAAGTSINHKAGTDFGVHAGKHVSVEAGTDFSVTAGAKGSIDIKDKLVLKCGKASITMTSGGDIEIKGLKVTVHGKSGTKVKGAKVAAN
jgi:type VI secretion system secreted protein VgrG